MTKLGLSSLRELFQNAEGPEGFEDLPERLEAIIHGLHDADPNFRRDIFEILRTTVELCSDLSRPTYDARRAAGNCGHLHALASRIMLHLMSRPQSTAYGILFPRTNTLHEDICSSEEEAHNKLEGLKRIGLREAGEVVQVTITSTKLSQPKAATKDEPTLDDLTQKIEKARTP